MQSWKSARDAWRVGAPVYLCARPCNGTRLEVRRLVNLGVMSNKSSRNVDSVSQRVWSSEFELESELNRLFTLVAVLAPLDRFQNCMRSGSEFGSRPFDVVLQVMRVVQEMRAVRSSVTPNLMRYPITGQARALRRFAEEEAMKIGQGWRHDSPKKRRRKSD